MEDITERGAVIFIQGGVMVVNENRAKVHRLLNDNKDFIEVHDGLTDEVWTVSRAQVLNVRAQKDEEIAQLQAARAQANGIEVAQMLPTAVPPNMNMNPIH